MQIDTDVVKKIIENSSQVIIMAHHNLDLDALGASLGIYYLCKSLGKKSSLLVEDKCHEAGVAKSFEEIKKRKINLHAKTFEEIKESIDEESLLIILDTNIPHLFQSKDISSLIKKIIIIDHHIPAEAQFVTGAYKYIGEEQSSTVEIVIEMLQKLDIYIHPYIATIMLAGIFVDTNHFLSKTNYKTYEGAAYLYKCGALSKELQYLLKEDANRYNDRQKVIKEAIIIGNRFIVASGHNRNYYRKEDLAKISDSMLLFNNIEASFTIGKLNNKTIGISARSLGNVNVQKIMEKLGGGGHFYDAATQLKDKTLKAAKKDLIKIINQLKGGF